MFNAIVSLMLTFSVLTLVSCSSTPDVTELPPTANAKDELEKVTSAMDQAKREQVDVLSPSNYKSAEEAREGAIEGRARNKDQEYVLYKIALAQAYLDKANEVAKVGSQVLKGPLEARAAAVDAKASRHYPDEAADLDNQFRKLSAKVEKNDTSAAREESDELESGYRKLTLKAIKKTALGSAESKIKQAKDEGAKELTPDILAWTEEKYAAAEANIDKNWSNPVRVDEAGTEATSAANRLLSMVRSAKQATAMDPQDYARQMEKQQKALSETQQDLSEVTSEVETAEAKAAATMERTGELESQVWLDRKFEVARQAFAQDEAEVYRQGDKLLLRLKGLAFPSNRATIPNEKFELLSKVQKVIGDVSPEQVVIEGHTDSIGNKELNEQLSMERAEAVKNYLVANDVVDEGKIVASGFGDSKPISSNKTREGRAQNRRVDVIISAESEKGMQDQQQEEQGQAQ